ncbi:MAG: beta-glucosidase BglX [Bacteroidales bacterium]|nr:beta-glucosidase BglX [Bacteroidales bacterium]
MRTLQLFKLVLSFLLLIASNLMLMAQLSVSDQQKLDELMSKMTLEEKIGQLNQYTGDYEATGPIKQVGDKAEEIRQGKVGSMLNIKGTENTRILQEIAMQSRLKIPLLFGLDVVHGYYTTFPIPLGEAASWDLEAIEHSARIAATEAASGGVHWTFAPMVDIARDPRWGRVMEGAGEDTWLGAKIAAARVRGFQGKGLGSTDAVMACAKHFAAYGAAVGGRDYNSVDMSERMLRETYLPPFKACAEAGAATFMNSFNDLNGIPATGNAFLQREVLKGEWNFQGFVVSDWGSMGEMIAHGYCKDEKEAAMKSMIAGSDMDMESRVYTRELANLVKEGKVPMALIDEAVKRILTKKFEMGLFDDPFRFCDPEREKAVLHDAANRATARDIARKSIVLLKNDNQTLPIDLKSKDKNIKTIALIGPLAQSENDMLGFWSISWPDGDIVSQEEGIRTRLPEDVTLLVSKGCEINDKSKAGFDEAIAMAKKADIVILSIGEALDMSGEAKSKGHIRLPGVQEELAQAIYGTGKPVVVILNAGRPLVFNWVADNMPAILYTWWLGSEAGNAIADVVFGDYNPSGKLPMTFPRDEGQIPLYYNYFSTGRPAGGDNDTQYRSAYIDMPLSPKFPFGYGLSYTTFEYSGLKLSSKTMTENETLQITFQLKNAGNLAGEEVVQLYLKDCFGSVVRPVKELKDFQKLMLQPGESKTIAFDIDKEKLSFYNNDLKWVAEPGEFELMIGSSSADIRLKDKFELK